MDIVDNQIGLLYKFQKKRNGDFWIISALGQESVNNKFTVDLILDNEDKLRKILELSKSNYEFMPAMHPDLNIKTNNVENLKKLKRKFSSLTDENGEKIIVERYDSINNTINFVTESTNNLMKKKSVFFNNKRYSLSQLGLKLIKRDIGTAYHTNKGIFISNKKIGKSDDIINTKFFHKHLIEIFCL